MIIKRPSVGFLKPYTENKCEDYWSCEEIGALIITIDALGSDGNILMVSIRWNNSTDSEKEKFPNTFEGFHTACGWLDRKRVEYAEKLL